MLEIYNGREKFYQWDIGQKLIVNDDIVAVQYDNGTGDALVCPVYEYEGQKVADVPNIMLQTSWAIHAYAYCGECVRGDKVIEVEKRSRPDDYVYTETETLRYTTLYERVKTLEEQHIEEVEGVAGELAATNAAVNAAIGRIEELEKNPVSGVKDWNENNPNSPNYIANRTHWEEYGEMEIMPETAADAVIPDEGLAIYFNPLSLEIGKQYKVWYNGTLYITTAADGLAMDMPGVALGNMGAITGGTDTGEPFILAAFNEEMAAEMGIGIMVMPMDGATEVSLRIVGEGTIIHKIDDKYINVREPDWNATIGESGYIANRTHYKDKGGTYEYYEDLPFAKVSFVMDNGITAYQVAEKPISPAALENTEFSYWDDEGFSHVITGGITHTGNNFYHYSYNNNTGFLSVADEVEATLTLGVDVPAKGIYLYTNEYSGLLLNVPDAVNKLPMEYIDTTNLVVKPDYMPIKTLYMKDKKDTGVIDVSGYNRIRIIIYGAVAQTTDTMKLRVYGADNKHITDLSITDIITETNSINQYITMYFDGDSVVFEKEDMAKVQFNPTYKYRRSWVGNKKEFSTVQLYTTNYTFKSSNDYIQIKGAND